VVPGLVVVRVAANLHPDCNGCPQLASKAWGERKYLTFGLTMNVWTHCNLACKYCFTVVPGFVYSRVKYPVVEVIADMLSGRHLDPAGNVAWGGGDISALPEFNDLSKLFLEYGAHQDFKTSGSKYLGGVANTIGTVRPDGTRLGTVEVSIDAGTRGTYGSYKGKDVFDRVIENILRYCEHGPVQLKYIAAECNLSDADIDGFLQIVEEAQPKHVTVICEYNDSWNGKYTSQHIGQIAKLMTAIREAKTPLIPNTHEDFVMRFPDFWAQLEQDLQGVGETTT
jgi:MoaA/NifB/PqqE/SkfB family radical SAM enzyme